MKEARMHMYIGDVISLQGELTFEEKSEFIHGTLAPEMYKVTERTLKSAFIDPWARDRFVVNYLRIKETSL
jgi:hypothetical protein